jgi:glycerol-3-phosphate cytidylyltransferase
MKTILTFGTYDLLHIGHVRILERAAKLGDKLIVGVSCSELNRTKKGRAPVYSTQDRCDIVRALACVDEVFVEKSLEAKGDYIKQYKADVLVMGDDWAGRFDEFNDLCSVVYLPRTQGISTSKLIADISDINPGPNSHPA